MATYGEIEEFSYEELSRLTHEQVALAMSEVWSLLRDLDPNDRAELLDGGTRPQERLMEAVLYR